MFELIERFETFSTSVTKVYKHIQKIKTIEAERIGLKGNHAMYLHHLGKNPKGLTPIELSKYCLEDKASVSRSILELTKKGYVKVSDEDLKRKYRARIVLTENAIEINKKIDAIIIDAVNKASKDLNEDERKAFYSVFNTIASNLENISNSYTKE